MGQINSLNKQEDRMNERICKTMTNFQGFFIHIQEANHWAEICHLPETCRLSFRVSIDPKVSLDLLPYIWKINDKIQVEVRKIRRNIVKETSGTYFPNIGPRKILTIKQFYYIYCFLSDIKDYTDNNVSNHSISLQNKKEIIQQDIMDDKECQICMDNKKEIVLPCAHSFCRPCSITWHAQNQTCPMCRYHLNDSNNTNKTYEEEVWELTASDIFTDMTSYVKDLISRIYEYLEKMRVCLLTEEQVIQSNNLFTYLYYRKYHNTFINNATSLFHTNLNKETIDSISSTDSQSKETNNNNENDDYLFALSLSNENDQHRIEMEIKRSVKDQPLSLQIP